MSSAIRTLLTAAAVVAFSTPAFAIFALVPADRVDEVPVERLLANLQRNAQNLTPAVQWRMIGRLHLLAYLRQVTKLPVYRERPDDIAEGRIDDCAKLDAAATGKGPRNFPPAKPGERCEARDYSLAPEREIPFDGFDKERPRNAHLQAAIEAYVKSRDLEPDNMRTRIALAFAFERAGFTDDARGELRYLLNLGLKQTVPLPRARQEQMNWELHTVLSEGVDHFTRIAESSGDKALIAEMKSRLDAAPPAMMVTPILVPLKQNVAFNDLIDRASDVAFDFTGQGKAEQLGWLTTDAAWLVWDPKQKKKIVSGFQLFGSVTWISFWDNGYQALGSLDDNGDGKLTGKELKGLALWRDANGDGESGDDEVAPLAEHGIVALSYANTRTSNELWQSEKGVTFRDGETRATYDWQLRSPPVLASD